MDRICKSLYSNKKLGLTARSMTVEDINEIFQKTIPDSGEKYAFYPRGTVVSGTIEFEGNEYKKKTNEWRVSKFYSCDGGGVTKIDNDGIEYSEPEVDNPVYVSDTFYNYKLQNANSSINSVLGTATSWLASKCVYLSKTAGFGVRTANSGGVSADILYDTYGNSEKVNYGIHPIVEIEYDYYSIDTSDSSKNGSSIAKAWKIVKDE